MVSFELSQPISRRPPKPNQVRNAYRKRGGRPRLSEAEKRQIERARVLEQRAEEERKKEKRKKELAEKRREKECVERDRRRNLGPGVAPEQTTSSQVTLATFFGPTRRAESKLHQSSGQYHMSVEQPGFHDRESQLKRENLQPNGFEKERRSSQSTARNVAKENENSPEKKDNPEEESSLQQKARHSSQQSKPASCGLHVRSNDRCSPPQSDLKRTIKPQPSETVAESNDISAENRSADHPANVTSLFSDYSQSRTRSASNKQASVNDDEHPKKRRLSSIVERNELKDAKRRPLGIISVNRPSVRPLRHPFKDDILSDDDLSCFLVSSTQIEREIHEESKPVSRESGPTLNCISCIGSKDPSHLHRHQAVKENRVRRQNRANPSITPLTNPLVGPHEGISMTISGAIDGLPELSTQELDDFGSSPMDSQNTLENPGVSDAVKKQEKPGKPGSAIDNTSFDIGIADDDWRDIDIDDLIVKK